MSNNNICNKSSINFRVTLIVKVDEVGEDGTLNPGKFNPLEPIAEYAKEITVDDEDMADKIYGAIKCVSEHEIKLITDNGAEYMEEHSEREIYECNHCYNYFVEELTGADKDGLTVSLECMANQ
jgi:hypothetical protein